MMVNTTYLNKEAKAWVKRKSGPDEIVRVIPEVELTGAGRCYYLYTAFDTHPDELGRILFDAQGYWIYDGNLLSVDEQEQVARFIINYVEVF
ncbi:MAG: hypothetical protein EOP47_17740 [Sphingobacteriaceae bacterium]|nr:MAG: hypothetical protein EOP47_17740 [Sphingobacteriaceae bacterium]